MELLVYVPQLSPRIRYIFSFIFEDVLKTQLSFTTNPEEFKQSNLPKFSYARQPIAGELFFKSTDLLFEYKITDQHISTTTFGELSVPFPVTKSTLPFDVFAASFYFLSRYEEYLPFKAASNEAYPAENSMQHQLGLLKLPVIDNWALILKNILLKHFPQLPFGNRSFTFYPIYARAVQKRSDKKNIISATISKLKAYLDKKINNKEENLALIHGLINDMQQRNQAKKPLLLTAEQKNEHHFNTDMQMPKSYLKLTKNEVKNDYSIYYRKHPGFRAGTCNAFQWYDLQLEKNTRLRLHPVAVTDATLLNHKTEDPLLQINELIDQVKLVNGDFYFLSLCNDIRPQ